MKALSTVFCLLIALLMVQPASAIVVVTPEKEATTVADETAPTKKLTKKELRQQKKEIRKERKQQRKEFRKNLRKSLKEMRADGNVSLAALVIIAILLPPVAMALYDGISSRFWISLLLTLLFYLPGLIYTLVVILGER